MKAHNCSHPQAAPSSATQPGFDVRKSERDTEDKPIINGVVSNPPAACDGDPVPLLHYLLGKETVFIAWPKGVKGDKTKWRHLQLTTMTPDYLATLKDGNIGVVLGQKSTGLCAIDCDDDEFAQAFSSANPQLSSTLQTHGARGRVFWLRFAGAYPRRTVKLKDADGRDVGEFRSNGAQSIVWGTHPDTREPYKFVVQHPVMVVEYHSLKWPTWLKAPPALGLGTEGTEADGSDPSHSVTSVSSVASVSSVLIGTPLSSSVPGGAAFQIQSIDDVLRRCMPDRVHENNHLLFILARGIKSLEQSRSSSFSQDEKREFFEQWHTQAGPFLRPGQSKDDYWIEFLNAVRRAKFPLGGQALANAWAAAQLNQPPPEALQFDKPELRLLVSFCWELQAINGGNQFYLSARVCAELFGHPSHTLAYKWLCALCQLGILVVVERGNSHKATRYRYISAG